MRLIAIVFMFFLACPVEARPVAEKGGVSWEISEEADGYFLYWAGSADTDGFIDSKKYRIPNAIVGQIAFRDISGLGDGRCFAITNYINSPVEGLVESAFSKPVCIPKGNVITIYIDEITVTIRSGGGE